jgi:hypothetical protein
MTMMHDVYQLPCTDCGAPTPTKRPKPRRCDPCAKAEALDYSRWHYRTFRDEMLEYHRNHYRKNRERILAKRAARRAAVNNGSGTTSFFNRNGSFSGSAGSSIDRAFNFNRR